MCSLPRNSQQNSSRVRPRSRLLLDLAQELAERVDVLPHRRVGRRSPVPSERAAIAHAGEGVVHGELALLDPCQLLLLVFLHAVCLRHEDLCGERLAARRGVAWLALNAQAAGPRGGRLAPLCARTLRGRCRRTARRVIRAALLRRGVAVVEQTEPLRDLPRDVLAQRRDVRVDVLRGRATHPLLPLGRQRWTTGPVDRAVEVWHSVGQPREALRSGELACGDAAVQLRLVPLEPAHPVDAEVMLSCRPHVDARLLEDDRVTLPASRRVFRRERRHVSPGPDCLV
mmetsp:Transcript_50103/g.161825  ORF Transcript_50103/g.161825 Transcript_50103/m.161825 type:complete len:285 (-) Transcript_50103:18-872(-)